MIRRPPISTRVRSSAASDVYKRQHIAFSNFAPLGSTYSSRGSLKGIGTSALAIIFTGALIILKYSSPINADTSLLNPQEIGLSSIITTFPVLDIDFFRVSLSKGNRVR